jgi:membrane protein YqaA with SNARE-associated domain
MLDRLYQWTLAKAAHRHAEYWLFVISFMESSFRSRRTRCSA